MRRPILLTPRLQLCEADDGDAAFILRLLNEPAFHQFIGDRGVRTLADAQHYIATHLQASYAANGFGLYVVARQADGIPLGICGLIRRATLPDVDLGYAFLSEHWGQGYALEAATAALNQGRETFGLRRIVAVVAPDNARSIRTLEKLGLRSEGVMQWPDDGAELCLYAWSAAADPV